MSLKPWHKVVTPREDLRAGKPLDASEFAVHLDQVRDGRAHEDYQKPDRFFERTFLTKNLRELSAQVVRRLSGEKTETSAVFNMTTQFGGGKTHALTLLYHLANLGPKAHGLAGVNQIIETAGIKEIPQSAVATFVGTQFDGVKGRGGNDGTPLRKTPWGEIAYQLGGEKSFKAVEQHDREMTSPAGDVIRDMLPKDRPSLILLDEIMNFVSVNRRTGLAAQFYNFLQNLSEEARGSNKVVLVASIPASELEMNAEDQADFNRFKKVLDRLGKAVIMSSETETSEIIRRRLFEWDPKAISKDGKVLLSKDALATCKEYAAWMGENRTQVPGWYADHAAAAFEATYPFHPRAISVFEDKWRALPRFQQTRGVLRMLALWVSNAYQQAYKGAHGDSVITLGTAPLEDSFFRSAVLEQLGDSSFEGVITADICGKAESHAVVLDTEAEPSLKKARIHRQTATAIFFEGQGGQAKNTVSVPEIRLAVAGPDIEIGNVETALEGLTEACFYLAVERNQYCFSLKENLNKRYSIRRAGIKDDDVEKMVREKIEEAFPAIEGIDRVFFPEKSGQIPDKPSLTFVVVSPENAVQDDPKVQQRIGQLIKESGTGSRTYKSGLLFLVPEAQEPLKEEARKLIAWTEIEGEGLTLDDVQERQLQENIKRAKRDMREVVWRTYKNVLFLGKDNQIKPVDLGLVTSSAAESLCKFILLNLKQTGEIEKDISPRFLVRNWPPAFVEWSTASVRDAFYASPQFPRIMNPESVRDAITRGVAEGHLAYVGKSPKGGYEPFVYKKAMSAVDVEISEDMFIIKSEEAEKHIKPPQLTRISISPDRVQVQPGKKQTFVVQGYDQFGRAFEPGKVEWAATGGQIAADGVFEAGKDEGSFIVTAKSGKIATTAGVTVAKDSTPSHPPSSDGKTIAWSGEVSPQKWMKFYTNVLARYARDGNLKITVSFEASTKGSGATHCDETKSSLRELGLDDDVRLK